MSLTDNVDDEEEVNQEENLEKDVKQVAVDVSPRLTTAVIDEALIKLEEAINILCEADPHRERSQQCERAILVAISPYKALKTKMSRKRKQSLLESYFSKKSKP